MERTLSIVKPDASKRQLHYKVIGKLQKNGLRLIGMKMVHFSNELAKSFYDVHKERPFFGELVESITSHPVVVMILEGENAVKKCRDIMGATDPKNAEPMTIRREIGVSIGENSVHGSDSPENAEKEIALMFKKEEIFA